MILLASGLVALVGLFVVSTTENARGQQIGYYTYFAGLLVFLYQLGPIVAKILP